MKIKKCHDCGTPEGHLHDLYCDMERCPFCGGQLSTCDCSYKRLGYDYDFFAPNCGLPQDIYENGLPDELKEQWEDLLERKGRIPYIEYPSICGRCGDLWPGMFRVPNAEWSHYIEPKMRGEMLCRTCYDSIKNMIDAGTEKIPYFTVVLEKDSKEERGDFLEKYGVSLEDYQLAAKAGKRLMTCAGTSDFLRVFFNNVVNGCKTIGANPTKTFKAIVDDLQKRIDSPKTPKEFFEDYGFFENQMN